MKNYVTPTKQNKKELPFLIAVIMTGVLDHQVPRDIIGSVLTIFKILWKISLVSFTQNIFLI